jgi:predicted DNA-binding protein
MEKICVGFKTWKDYKEILDKLSKEQRKTISQYLHELIEKDLKEKKLIK